MARTTGSREAQRYSVELTIAAVTLSQVEWG